MKFLSLILFIFLLFSGCSESNNSSDTQGREAPFSVTLSPSLAPATYTTIPVNSKLLLDVSTALDSATVNNSSVYIQDMTGQRHITDVTLVSNQIVLQPKVYFTENTTYEIIVTTDVHTAAGESLNRKAIISFTSGPTIDSTSPTLMITLPSGFDNPEPFGIIYFQFSEPLSPLLDPTLFRIYDNNGDVLGTTKFSGALISFTPESNLTFNKQYFVELNTSSITDLSSNPYNGPILEDFNFTVTSLSNAKPIATYSETSQTFSTNTKVNTIFALSPIVSDGNTTTELFLGTEDGLKIISFDLNDTNFSHSTFTYTAGLSLSEVGIVYDMELNASTDRAYLATSQGAYIVDINDTSNPSIINSYKTVDTDNHAVPVYGLDASNTHLYLAATTLGIYDLNISFESDISVLFSADTNGTAFDIVDNAGTLFVSDYNKNLQHFDLNGNLQAPLTPGILGTTHNIISYFDNGNAVNVSMVAAGIRGLGYIDTYLGSQVGTLATPSYTSQLRRNAFAPDRSFAVLKDLGIVYFSPLQYSSITINQYQLLPYDITSAGYTAYEAQDLSINFAADTNGTIHAYYVP